MESFLVTRWDACMVFIPPQASLSRSAEGCAQTHTEPSCAQVKHTNTHAGSGASVSWRLRGSINLKSPIPPHNGKTHFLQSSPVCPYHHNLFQSLTASCHLMSQDLFQWSSSGVHTRVHNPERIFKGSLILVTFFKKGRISHNLVKTQTSRHFVNY